MIVKGRAVHERLGRSYRVEACVDPWGLLKEPCVFGGPQGYVPPHHGYTIVLPLTAAPYLVLGLLVQGYVLKLVPAAARGRG